MEGLLTLPYPQLLDRIIAAIPGGIGNIIMFAPIDRLLNYPDMDPVNNSYGQISLLNTAWSTAKLPDQGKAYTESPEENDAGHFTKCRVEGFSPYYKKQNMLALNAMKYYRFIVIIRQRDNTFRVMGTPENGAHFGYSFSTGGHGGDVAGANIWFDWLSEDGAAYYEPPVPPFIF